MSEAEEPTGTLTGMSTGVTALDDALAQLDGLAERGVEEHPAAFERVHATMRAVLDGDDA